MAINPADLSANLDILYSNEALLCQEFKAQALTRTIGDYRKPNEASPQNVKPHLALMEKGWIVSTGTQRCFFDLLLSPEDKCEGLITVDIDPIATAYNHFLVLLLYFSDDLKTFHTLWETEQSCLIEILKEKIMSSTMPDKLRFYYIQNIEHFADCYFGVGRDSINTHFPEHGDNIGIEYHKDEVLFQKLRGYARDFKIIPICGDISDLSFARGRKIAIIDVSNIGDYSALCFKKYEDNKPRIVSTELIYTKTIYYSGLYEVPSQEIIKKMNSYFKLFRSYEDNGSMRFQDLYTVFRQALKDGLIEKISDTAHLPYNFYSEENANYLEIIFDAVIQHKRTLSDIEYNITREAYNSLVKGINPTKELKSNIKFWGRISDFFDSFSEDKTSSGESPSTFQSTGRSNTRAL